MPLPGTPHTGKIAVGFVKDNQQEYMTFYVEDTGDGIFSDVSTFLNDVAEAVVENLIPVMYASIAFNTLVFEDVRDVPFGGFSISINPPEAGALSATAQMPNEVALAVKRSSATPGRSGRGRVYWPSIDAGDLISGNTVEDTYVASVISALQAFQTDVEAFSGTISLGHVSYYTDNTPRDPGVFYQTINWSVTDKTVDSQRRRGPGRGN